MMGLIFTNSFLQASNLPQYDFAISVSHCHFEHRFFRIQTSCIRISAALGQEANGLIVFNFIQSSSSHYKCCFQRDVTVLRLYGINICAIVNQQSDELMFVLGHCEPEGSAGKWLDI